jgi:undecaprenyl-diphosphatase
MQLISLLSALNSLDWSLFRFINSDMGHPLLDAIVPMLRNGWFWLPLYVLVIALMVQRWKRRAWLVLFFFLLTAGTCDYVSASVIKPWVHRERPCNDPEKATRVELRVSCGVGYSLPSAHATNHMGMAVYLLLLFGGMYRNSRYLFLLWAILVSFAQVYVGVHYPSDILAGWILGGCIAWVFYALARFYMKYFYNQPLTGD